MLQKVSGVRIVFDKGADRQAHRPATLNMRGVPLKTALTWVTKAHGLRWVIHEGKVVITATAPPGGHPEARRRDHAAPRHHEDEEKEVF